MGKVRDRLKEKKILQGDLLKKIGTDEGPVKKLLKGRKILKK